MGKKAKVGKARKDKFYHLAKETGFRARSAFKLLQLNRKYEFLQTSRVCVDLCAAPGGWLQVAAQNMPMSSVIVGIDLVPIKPIPNCSTFQADITTEKCRQILKKELQTWKADVFLNDGAPNVGQNWLQDAFAQAELTLSAMKLATDFLRKGGWFVTKVFRSKDYHSLMWVFNQLFNKVYATKPQASRNESAEIFVVCQGFLAPDKLDPKFTDPKYVFEEVASEMKTGINMIHPTKVKKKAEGYADGELNLHHKLKVSEFFASANHTELLANCHELVMDDETIANHPLTTKEILECLNDVRVLGKRELKSIISWRKKIKLLEKKKQEAKTKKEEGMEVEEIGEDSEEEIEAMTKKIAELQEEEDHALKRKRKRVLKEKRKLRDKMALNMVIKGDKMDVGGEIEMFNLKNIKKKAQLENVGNDVEMPEVESDESDSDQVLRRNKISFDRDDKSYLDESLSEDDDDYGDDLNEESDVNSSDEYDESSGDDSDDERDKSKNPLLVNLEGKDSIQKKRTEMWFKKGAFDGMDMDADEDFEVNKMMEDYKRKGGKVKDKKLKKKKQVEDEVEAPADSGHGSENSEDGDSSDSDSDSDYDIQNVVPTKTKGKKRALNKSNKDGFEIVSTAEPAKKIVKLDPVELAIGEELIKSSKRRRELIEDSYNRYTFNDEDLPDWFVKDEAQHYRRQLPVTKEQVRAYKEKMKAINARAPKKVIEAKARKKYKSMKKLEKARKKAEVVTDNQDTSEKEKWSQIKQIYKKAGLLNKKKRELTYVVAKKGAGKKVRRPAGVKGQFKVVDPRMKKDLRSEKGKDKKKGGKTSRGKGKKR